ncbi:sensor histidine kinase [Actinomyces qiguomingii]|uniref:sensor histidine kinase n=1 Tax=Actinomyces qiguomingii TaxID=2057800 RepID=UPI000CA043CC|nr:ATP-binding protein [Actinomyces qiguomingii]
MTAFDSPDVSAATDRAAHLSAHASGPYTLRLRRLVTVVAGGVTAATGVNIAFTISAVVGATAQNVFWLLLPALVAPAMVAGIAAGIALRGSTPTLRPSDTIQPVTDRRKGVTADRIWTGALSLSLVVYVILVLLAAVFPVLPSHSQFDTFVHTPNVLVNCYLGIAVAATLILSPRSRFLYIVLLSPLLVATYPAGDGLAVAIEEVLVYLAPSVGNMGMLTWLLAQAAALDDADARRHVEVIQLRTATSRSRARRRADNLIHDHILSVLKAVPTAQFTSSQLRYGARLALTRLESTTRDLPATGSTAFLHELHRTLSGIGGSKVSFTTLITRDLELAPDAAEAITAAAMEALRNTLVHASPYPDRPIERAVELRSDTHGITVTVSDNGCGFDPARVVAGRHGIAKSIINRMQDVGGTAHISSSPGRGTTVTLTWCNRKPVVGTDPAPLRPGTSNVGLQAASSLSDRSLRPGTSNVGLQAPSSLSDRSLRLGTRNVETRLEVPVPQTRTSPLSLASCMETPSTWIVSCCIFFLYILVTAMEVSFGSYRHSVPVIVGLAILGMAAFTIVKPWPRKVIPATASSAVAVATGIVNALVLFQINQMSRPSYADWCLGASTIICCGLLARERFRHAWAGTGLFLAVLGIWVLTTGQRPVMLLTLGFGQFLSLLIWYLAARLSLGVTARTAAAEAISSEYAAERQAHQESEAMMLNAMTSVRRRVSPLLISLAVGAPISDSMRTAARTLEAELRDERLAPLFTGTRVADCARAARARGIDVVLLDDRGDAATARDNLPDEVWKLLIDRAVQAIGSADKGQVVIRLLPPSQHPKLMSIVTEDAILTLGPDGTPKH